MLLTPRLEPYRAPERRDRRDHHVGMAFLWTGPLMLFVLLLLRIW